MWLELYCAHAINQCAEVYVVPTAKYRPLGEDSNQDSNRKSGLSPTSPPGMQVGHITDRRIIWCTLVSMQGNKAREYGGRAPRYSTRTQLYHIMLQK